MTLRRVITAAAFLVAASLPAVLVFSCSDNTPVCLPKTYTFCDCPTGPGYQQCDDKGLSFGACTCGQIPGDAGVDGIADGP